MQTSNKILVENLPPSYDEQHLQMFFEYDKGQIGQPVKKLTLNRDSHSALIEFESSRAVDIVLSKRPITIMDQTVDVDVLTSYLEDGVKLGSVSVTVRGVTGIPEALGEELIRLHLDDHEAVYKRILKQGDKVRVLKIPSGPIAFAMLFGNIQTGSVGTISSIESSEKALVVFPTGNYLFALRDIELVT